MQVFLWHGEMVCCRGYLLAEDVRTLSRSLTDLGSSSRAVVNGKESARNMVQIDQSLIIIIAA